MLKLVRRAAVGDFRAGFPSLAIIPAKQFAVMLKVAWLAFSVGCSVGLEGADC